MSDALVIKSNTVSKLDTEQLDFILLDGSGSMSLKWWPMLEAIDAYVLELRAAMVKSHIRMDIFDSQDIALTARNCHIDKWVTFDKDPVGAYFNSTPLYDAIVIMTKNIRDLNPAKCAVTIVTDGEDTGNKFADLNMARECLDWLRAQGFSVTFIGCDFDNNRQARALGANPSNSIGVRQEKLTDATKLYAKKRTQNVRDGSDINFTDDEKRKFGGYLSHDSTTKH